jgi:hypothetical protein
VKFEVEGLLVKNPKTKSKPQRKSKTPTAIIELILGICFFWIFLGFCVLDFVVLVVFEFLSLNLIEIKEKR